MENNLALYAEEAKQILDISYLDGYGKVEKVEELLKTLPPAATYTNHYFSDGVYTRESFIPANTMLTGWRHKTSTISIMMFGVISIVLIDEFGKASDITMFNGDHIFVTKPHTKKVGFAHEDTLFVNSFSLAGLDPKYWNEDNIDKVEEFLFEKETS